MNPLIVQEILVYLLMGLANTATAAQTTWSSVIFTVSGETSPVLLPNSTLHLTPLGANQLFNVGALIRARYLEATTTSLTDAELINGLASTEIDNTLTSVLATDDEWVSTGAQAFMQGLYPPLKRINVDIENVLANGTLEEWPLDGYQYANIRTFSAADYNQIWLAGSEGCPNWDIASSSYLGSSEYHSLRQSTAPFYQSLVPSLFNEILPTAQLTYYNALQLYDYAAYEYIYNATVVDSVSTTDLNYLRYLANEMASAFYGNTSLSMNDGDQVGVIGGRTLATLILQLLILNINHSGTQHKMSLLFGDYGPMISFLALSGFSSISPMYTGIPQSGSIIVFELFSVNTTATDPDSSEIAYPDASDLWVRFLFRNGTDENIPLLSYPLFGRGNSQIDMPWSDFVTAMEAFMVNGVDEWCNTCESASVWCPGFIQNSDGDMPSQSAPTTNSEHSMRPVIAGVVGALVTLATILLLALALGLFGFRVEKRDRIGIVGAGGFKGHGKEEEDRDVIVVGDGKGAMVKHERVGSWELRDNVGDDAAKLNMVAGAAGGPAPAYRKDEEEWEVDPYGNGVEIREHV